MLSAGWMNDAGGAMLLFVTNFLCIMVMGIITMYMYGIHKKSRRSGARYLVTAFIICFAALALVAVPLYFSSQRLGEEANARVCLEDYINGVGSQYGWKVRVVIAKAENNCEFHRSKCSLDLIYS
jgi:uncharacterized membrane protein